MKIGVFGTGDVGRQIASRLIEVGHEVMLGSRTADHAGATEWAKNAGGRASNGTFADAAAFGEMLFNCTKGEHSLAVLEAAGAKNLDGKVLVDISNPLDFSRGFPPSLSVSNTDSLGEQIQAKYASTKVVKAFNTMANPIMVNPRSLPDTHQAFLSGNDEGAKGAVRGIMESFGWRADEILDLGDITTARGTEMFLPLWVRIFGATQNPIFNIKLVRPAS